MLETLVFIFSVSIEYLKKAWFRPGYKILEVDKMSENLGLGEAQKCQKMIWPKYKNVGK